MPMLYSSFQCTSGMISSSFLFDISTKREVLGIGAEVDHQVLVDGEHDITGLGIVEALGSRRVAHAYGNCVRTGGHHETFIDPGRAVTRDSCGWQRCAIDGATVDIELDIDRAAPTWTLQGVAHVGRQLRQLLRGPSAAFRLPVRSVGEAELDDRRLRGDLLIAWPVGEGRYRRENRGQDD